jgi:hypothetical protein
MILVKLTRVELAVTSAILSASVLLAAPGTASAQAGCQPTIMQPCTNAPARANNPATGQKKSTRADEDNGPKDHSPRIRLDSDTEFKFGTGGIGLGRKF